MSRSASMPTRCVCGNETSPEPDFKVTHSPCRCETPGSGRRTLGAQGMPRYVSKQQFEERRRLGLPVVTDIERGSYSRWA